MVWQFCCHRRALPSKPPWLRISSVCEGACIHLAEPREVQPEHWRKDDPWHADSRSDQKNVGWEGFCACCKRPLSVEFVDAPVDPATSAPNSKRRKFQNEEQHAHASSSVDLQGRSVPSEERYAYVCSLWGGKENAEYLLGALVLAWSLRKTGTPHDLVALVTQVEPAAQELLRQAGWKVHNVDHVTASDNLAAWFCLDMHFAQVFTKMHVLGLVQYSKVVMLDVDILVKQNIDDLFELPAPAAMVRGPQVSYSHGERIDCRIFFKGACSGSDSWGQGCGINAGVMLLKPDANALQCILAEIADDKNPSHIRGKGPEQDYLSRFYAGAHEDIPGNGWLHLDIGYNFQLHQMYFALSPKYRGRGSRVKFFQDPELIKVIHYSGTLRPWTHFLDPSHVEKSKEQWLDAVLETFKGYWLWVKRDPETIKAHGTSEGVALAPDGRIHFIDWAKHWSNKQSWKSSWKSSWHDTGSSDKAETLVESDDVKDTTASEYPLGEVAEIPEFMISGSSQIVRMSHDLWAKAYHELAAELGHADLASVAKAAVSKAN